MLYPLSTAMAAWGQNSALNVSPNACPLGALGCIYAALVNVSYFYPEMVGFKAPLQQTMAC